MGSMHRQWGAPSGSHEREAATYPAALLHGAAAFSLVELVLVTAIVATVAAVAVPRYANSLARYRVDAAARRVVVDLELAAAQARTTSTGLTINFNTVTNQYQIPGLDQVLGGLPGGVTDYTVLLNKAPYHANLVSAAFAASPSVTFNGFGEANANGTVVVTVGDTTRTVTFDRVRGEARIQ